MSVISVSDLDDPRLADYANVRERQLAAEFRPGSVPGVGRAGASDATYGKFMAEGEVVFRHLVASPFRTLSVLCTPARAAMVESLVSSLKTPAPIYVVSPAALKHLVGFHLHRGLIAIGARNPPTAPLELLQEPGVYVLLEDLTNHDNVGSVFRNAAAFGARGVFLSPRCADPLYRKSIRVSVGHALRMPFAWLDNWPDDLVRLRQAGLHIVALSPLEPALHLRDWTWPPAVKKVCVMFGSEGPGLSSSALRMASERVAIPMNKGVDSLNVAVTSAVALEHLRWVQPRIQS